MSIEIDIEIDNEIAVLFEELTAARHAAHLAEHQLKQLVDRWSGNPRTLSTVAKLLLLAYEGRLADARRQGHKEVGLDTHLYNFSDATNPVHSAFSGWVKAALSQVVTEA